MICVHRIYGKIGNQGIGPTRRGKPENVPTNNKAISEVKVPVPQT